MEITEIPFNEFIGLKRSQQPELGALELDASPNYHNHIGTVHAAAQFALAEACSGEYLLSRFADLAKSHVAVVRKVEVKFRKPAVGNIFANAHIPDEKIRKLMTDITTKGRAFVEISVKVVDAQGEVTMAATLEWYLQKID
ncbi:MAG: YiiD C-terminal domain-containing protein [Anaerolineae bacterium]|nr:YiiD C-terminal domain-containing protein [Anaerolineae bacterium]